MKTASSDARPPAWRIACLVLITASLATITGRIMLVKSQQGETPFLSANDRSRWCTIRSLVDEGTYVIDTAVRDVHPETGRQHWKSIDSVRHRGPDGREHWYSSKPPLLPTLLAGQYWLLKQATGVEISRQPFYVGRFMLVVSNVLPLALFFWLLMRLLAQLAETDFSRIYILACAAFGTFLTTFAVTLNNHLPAAISVLIALAAAIPLWRKTSTHWGLYAIAGFFSAFAAANELPALSFLAFVGGALLLRSPLKTLFLFAPAAALVGAGFFGTNWLAHQSWRPAYAHRSDGPVIAQLEANIVKELNEAAKEEVPALPEELRQAANEAGVELSEETLILPSQKQRWIAWDRQGHDRLAIVQEGDQLLIKEWDDWYDYPRSYWTGPRSGVDKGEPSRAVYAFHTLIGHHGIFSLTPVWILSLLGLAVMFQNGKLELRGLALMTLLLSGVCLAFYIQRPLIDRNYGGVSTGLRWMFWLIPLWLLCLAPLLDLFSRYRGLRLLAYLLLAISVASATYGALNPWSQPWLFDYWTYLGWISYS